jgi:hypothetical protein
MRQGRAGGGGGSGVRSRACATCPPPVATSVLWFRRDLRLRDNPAWLPARRLRPGFGLIA